MDDCLFCKIIKEEIPILKIYEDGYVISFLDINPATKGHTLVVPKKHVKTIDELSEKDLANVSKGILKVSKAMLKFNEGLNIIQNNNEIAGQIVNHIHFHLIPRNSKDKGRFSWNGESYKGKVDEVTANKIKSFLR